MPRTRGPYFCVIFAEITDSPGAIIAGIISPAPRGPAKLNTPSANCGIGCIA